MRDGPGQEIRLSNIPSSLPLILGALETPWSLPGPVISKRTKRRGLNFTMFNDITPTIYDILGITPPKVVNGFKQIPMDGISMKYTFDNPNAPAAEKTQFFDNNGSRGIYHDGWYACTFGPLFPWLPAQPGLDQWDSKKDVCGSFIT